MHDTLNPSPPNTAANALRAKFFRGLADPSRLAIMESLRNSSQTVGELEVHTGLSQPNTSNHLACLLECGLVQREQNGRYAVYGLADDKITALLALADDLVSDHHERLAACVRYTGKEDRT